jgi:acyl carrier protein
MQVTQAGHVQLKQWILDRNPQINDIEPEYDVLENRLVDSLSFMEFVVLIARLSGKEICFDDLNVDDFRTLKGIAEHFFPTDAQ